MVVGTRGVAFRRGERMSLLRCLAAERRSRRRDESLLDLLERGEGLEAGGVRGKCGTRRQGDHARMGFGGEAQRGADRDVGVADAVAEPVGAGRAARSASSAASAAAICARQRPAQASDTSRCSRRS